MFPLYFDFVEAASRAAFSSLSRCYEIDGYSAESAVKRPYLLGHVLLEPACELNLLGLGVLDALFLCGKVSEGERGEQSVLIGGCHDIDPLAKEIVSNMHVLVTSITSRTLAQTKHCVNQPARRG